ncbi:MAG: NAD(P)/FAD-dependent oxidoreductase [Pseudomonadota bacterium]
MGNETKIAIIAGGGPAGLTAALELAQRTDIKPLVFEATDYVGGISRTHVHQGNRIDIGGHRFFSKSKRVMDWWRAVMPLQGLDGADESLRIAYQNKETVIDLPDDGPNPDETDLVMLVRPRKSRILFKGKLFDYPLSLSPDTLLKLGLLETGLIGLSYIKAHLLPRPERTLEDFLINRFGVRLYGTFFKEYTEKVWGRDCAHISAEWGAQRIKGLSLRGALLNAASKIFGFLRPKQVETSLIEQFLYPKFGPGQMWETATDLIRQAEGKVTLNARVTGVQMDGGKVISATIRHADGREEVLACDHFFSTLPISELFAITEPQMAGEAGDLAARLEYRDFMTVGLLCDRLTLGDCDGHDVTQKMPDNWIYVQEPGVRVGRLQFFNNWSPYLVADPAKVWIGLEYFCDEGDDLWSMDDEAMIDFAKAELEQIRVARAADAHQGVIIRVPKTYPAYWGTYDHFERIRAAVDPVENLWLIGRNGMHRYNNQDHSMLTAMMAVDNIIAGRTDTTNLWDVNLEQDYHEAGETE